MVGRDTVIILDFGGQYAHLLARRVRELGVYSEILLPDVSEKELSKAKGIILSGGPASVYDKDAPAFNPKMFNLGIPVLGLCYGQQLIGQEMGGKVSLGKIREYGEAKLTVTATTARLFSGVPKNFTVWMSHGDQISTLPSGFVGTASTSDCKFAAIANDEKKIYGLQFHPEVTHTEHGIELLSNFVFGVCKCKKSWSMEHYVEEKMAEIKKEAAGKKVFLLLSGGVDSAVCLALLAKALGPENIFALHVDTGFMRKNESELVKTEIELLGIKKVRVLSAEKQFIAALKGVADPEEKRGIIGKLFIELYEKEMKALGFDGSGWLLGQGTIYPDTIETGGTKHSNKIKTHHNRAPIILKMIDEGRVIEPLKLLYKDEVREAGRILGLPPKLVNRRPFPGPGLAIRILCSSGKEKGDEKAEAQINEWLGGRGYSARMLPIKAVGVQGDNRTYRNAVLLEGELDYGKLEKISTHITNAFNSVNRVVYLASPQKLKKLKLEAAFLTKSRVKILQDADDIATRAADELPDAGEIWQFPVVLIPVNFDGKGEGIVLRPVSSREAMTAKFYALDKKALGDMAKKIMKIKGIGAIMLDVTHKPPATIEWE